MQREQWKYLPSVGTALHNWHSTPSSSCPGDLKPEHVARGSRSSASCLLIGALASSAKPPIMLQRSYKVTWTLGGTRSIFSFNAQQSSRSITCPYVGNNSMHFPGK
ncbi:hypothetical protein KC19_9G113900 [Ceratodon purpureus]|uniref:Uncharacterized protein n=1 Tax=Ceratodon purpureus TaxID=3225 RepID=A0A8T0GSZ3_CERPU|nr:hypothetical protein KC19_9G113900 [Ceratodon purpureus]